MLSSRLRLDAWTIGAGLGADKASQALSRPASDDGFVLQNDRWPAMGRAIGTGWKREIPLFQPYLAVGAFLVGLAAQKGRNIEEIFLFGLGVCR